MATVIAAVMALRKQSASEPSDRWPSRRDQDSPASFVSSASGSPAAGRRFSDPGAMLALGQILALSSRETGSNGIFRKGDIGLGHQVADGWVQITWPNGTKTKTEWPNLSWYCGRPAESPVGASHCHIPVVPGEVVALASRPGGDNGVFHAGDVGALRLLAPGRAEIRWPNGTRTETAWPNPSWYAGRLCEGEGAAAGAVLCPLGPLGAPPALAGALGGVPESPGLEDDWDASEATPGLGDGHAVAAPPRHSHIVQHHLEHLDHLEHLAHKPGPFEVSSWGRRFSA